VRNNFKENIFMSEEIKKTKLNLKKARCAHLMENGDLKLFFEDIHKQSNKKIEWFEEIKKDDLPFKFRVCHNKSGYTFKSIYMEKGVVKLLNDLRSIELWPSNNSPDADYLLRSIVFNFKNEGCASFDEITINGKTIRSCYANLCC
jgi:hypothetical protein